MKISEITRPAYVNDAKVILQKAGYEQLGQGDFGSALTRPDKPFILKLFKTKDQAYLQYLKLITTISNPHFPIVKGKPTKVTDSYWAVQLEMLTPLTGEATSGPAGAAPVNARDLCFKCKDYISDLRYLKKLEQQELPYPRSPHINTEIHGIRNTVEKFRNRYPDLSKALELILKHVVEVVGAGIDMHDGNFLMRGNTLVITDPVAYQSKDSEDLSPALKTPKQLGFPWNNNTTPSTPSTTPSKTNDQEYPETMPQSGLYGVATPPLLRRLKFRTPDEKILNDLYKEIPLTSPRSVPGSTIWSSDAKRTWREN